MLEVANQTPPLENYNLLRSDAALREAIAREHAGWAEEELTSLGARFGAEETIAQGFDANRHSPALRAFDRTGDRIDEVDFHPSWHELMRACRRGGAAQQPLGRAQARGPCRARCGLLHAGADRERRLLSHGDDLRIGADLAPLA